MDIRVVDLLSLRTSLPRPPQQKGWSINSCPITGRSGSSGVLAARVFWQLGCFGSSGVLAEQEFSEGSSRGPMDLRAL